MSVFVYLAKKMIITEDIAIKVRQVLLDANIGVDVVWQRSDYETTKEIVIVPHTTTGEGSLREAAIIINIHCPDRWNGTAYEPDMQSLIDIKKSVISAVKRYYWKGTGINWKISSLGQPVKEPSYNEHFCSVYLTAYIRERNIT